jgi:hypothetical protein
MLKLFRENGKIILRVAMGNTFIQTVNCMKYPKFNEGNYDNDN